MRILILTTHLDAGGITSYLYNLLKGLLQHDQDVFLVSAGGNRARDFEQLGVRLITFPMRTKCEFSWRLAGPLFVLARLNRKERFDVIHAQTRVTQVLGSILSHICGCPLVTTCHGFFQRRLSRRLWPCWGTAVIAISPQVRKHLERDFHVDPNRIHDVRSGIDTSNYVLASPDDKKAKRKAYGIPEGAVIGIIARLSPEKGHRLLIQAMAHVIRHVPTARLLIIGKGRMEKDLQAKVENLHLARNVLFFDVIHQTPEFLSLMDIFILPSSQEGLGLSVMEAQAAGLPVIATRVGGLPNLIHDGDNGILIDLEDERGLAEAIVHLLNEPDLARAMGQRGRTFIEKEGSYQTMAQRTLQVYGRLAKSNRGA